jgi:hypothetical protein
VESIVRVIMKTLILALGLTLVGCGTAKPPEKPADKPAEMAIAPADPSPAGKPAATTFASDDEYVAKATDIVHKLMDIFKADGKDCDKLAADVSKLVDDPVVAASTAYEKAHPEAKAKFDQQSTAMVKEFGATVTPAIRVCGDNEALKAAFKKLAE